MFRDFSRNRFIISLFYLFLVVGLISLYFIPKPGLFLKLYAFHSPFLNAVMKILTYLGNGLTAVIVVTYFFFRKTRDGFFLLLSTALSGIVVQALKNFVFPGHLRPVKYFSELGITLDQVPGVDIHFYHSFPSGHTTTAFALWFGLSLLTRNIYLKVFLFILAIAVGYSRIYLGQHFPGDVLAGAVTGGLFAMVCLNYVNSWKKEWLDYSLISALRK